MKKKIMSLIIALFMVLTIMPAMTDTAHAATKITDKSVYYVTGYVSGDCLLTANIYMMRRAAITRGSTDWQQMNNTSINLRGALCTSKTRRSNQLKNKYSYTFDGLTFVGKNGSLSGSTSAKKKKIRNLLKEHPEGIAVWANNAGKGYPHAVLITEYKNGTFYCADSTHNASKYRKKGKNAGIEKFSRCTVSSISRLSKYWYLDEVKGVANSKPMEIKNDSATGKPVLKWNRVLNARKYKVQRKLSTSTNYTTIATVTTKTFTDAKAVSGKKYHYRIKAYDSKGKCIFTGDGRLRTCDLERPKVVLKVTEDAKVIVSWATVKNAKNYDVYRSTSKNGTYKRICSTSEISVVDSGVKLGKTYYYKVNAKHSDSAANSAYSLKKLITVEEPVIEEMPENILYEVK